MCFLTISFKRNSLNAFEMLPSNALDTVDWVTGSIWPVK